MLWKKHCWNGTKKALKTILDLAILIIPIHLVVAVCRAYGVMEIISHYGKPLMIPWGLPGEASIAMVLGYTVNLYAAVGAASALHLNWQQVTLIGAMLCICHSLPVETVIVKKVGVPIYQSLLTRLGISLLVGIILRIGFLWIG